MAERIPRPGEFYRHFKNRMYQIVTVAKHTETGEILVIYQALYGDFSVYARPLEMFMSEVDHKKYPRAAQKYRFERCTPGPGAGDPRGEQEDYGKKPAKNPEERLFREQQQEKQSRLEVWKEGEEETDGDGAEYISVNLFSDGEDYEEADELSGQESVVLPRSGRSEEREDDLWKSLTDEAVQAAGEENEEDEDGTEAVSPRFLDFLEARTFEAKAVILESMREELDDAMIDGLAMAVDVEIPEGPIEERYHQLEQCLRTMAKYEDGRSR